MSGKRTKQLRKEFLRLYGSSKYFKSNFRRFKKDWLNNS